MQVQVTVVLGHQPRIREHGYTNYVFNMSACVHFLHVIMPLYSTVCALHVQTACIQVTHTSVLRCTRVY
jgi:hypothetical protein